MTSAPTTKEDAILLPEDPKREKFRRRVNAVTRFAFAALFAVEVLSWSGILPLRPTFTWFGLTFTLLVVWAVFETVEFYRRRGSFPGFHWITGPLAFLAVTVDALGDISQFYNRWDWYDQMAHLTGGAIAVIVALNIVHVVARVRDEKLPRWAIILMSYGLSAVFSVCYELEEYLEDRFTGSHRLGDGFDTADDLMYDLLGAALVIIAILLVRYFRRKRKTAQSA